MVLGFTVAKFIYIKLNSFQIFICNHYFPKYAFKTNKKKQKESRLKEFIAYTSHHRDIMQKLAQQ